MIHRTRTVSRLEIGTCHTRRVNAPVFDLERAYADCHEIVLKHATAEAPCKVLDLAAGQGPLSYHLSQRGFDVTATEVYTDQFKAPGVPCIKANLNERIPFDDASFDLILAVEILEHLEAPRAFIREIHRLLRPGGRLIVSTPNIGSLQSRCFFLVTGYFDLFVPRESRLKDPYSSEADGHISPVPTWMLRYFLREQGFDVEAEEYTMAYFPGLPRWFLRHFHGSLLGRCGIWSARKR